MFFLTYKLPIYRNYIVFSVKKKEGLELLVTKMLLEKAILKFLLYVVTILNYLAGSKSVSARPTQI